MKTVVSELVALQLTSLVQAALQGTAPDESLFANIEETDWSTLFELSAAQGVTALAMTGMTRLSKNLQPPLAIKLRWIASAETIEKHYFHCLEVAEELSIRFRENNIRMMLFKGIALSRLYPIPQSREFGDIDIFLCGKSKGGDDLLERITDKISSPVDKHINFFYKGVMIENHQTLLDHDRSESFRRSKTLEKQLTAILTKTGILGETNFEASDLSDKSLLFPPPEFDALFITLHTLSHFPSGIVLRNLCDLAVLFTAYKGKIDFSLYLEVLSKAGLSKPADALISLTVRHLGLNPDDAPPYKSNTSLENRIWNDLLNPVDIPPLSEDERSLLNVLTRRIRLIQSHHWKSELVFPGRTIKDIFFFISFHFRRPKIIGKLITNPLRKLFH
ncbi:MAG: nucleotidyltransferase family protein [Dysgonamonadaceae bacterium]|jgi:hypothetical protein|nr:nucleotidyltransferase family protein [Dysgonamonadaceae bacterium]